MSAGLRTLIEPDEDIRRRFCWSLNEFYADHYLQFHDRLTPAGVIPMFTPDEALDELEHCHRLGLKVVHLPHGVPRPIPDVYQLSQSLYPRIHWLDTYGMDSAFNYDPVWQRLYDLGFAATFHGHSAHAAATKSSRSMTNYMFNHIGAHAGLMLELCKSLLLSGVTSRFEKLHFAFLEGGVHWAYALMNDFLEHWEKRNVTSIQAYDPRRLDTDKMRRLFCEWANPPFSLHNMDDLPGLYANRRESPLGDTAEPVCLDDFAMCNMNAASDIRRLFSNLYFGCEADDAMASLAFHPCHTAGTRLKAMFSSDFGHWDVGMLMRCCPPATIW